MEYSRYTFDQKWTSKTIDELIKDFMKEHELPGVGLAIVQAPYITRVNGYGYSDVLYYGEKLVGTKTIFPLLRISQAYLAVAIIQLHELGKINVYDPITKYLDLPPKYAVISVLDLLNNYTNLICFRTHKNYDRTHHFKQSEILAMLLAVNENLEVKLEYKLSASNSYLLTLLIDKMVAPLTYEEYVKLNQFKRAHLKETFFLKDLMEVKEEFFTPKNPHVLFKVLPEYINGLQVAKSLLNDHEYYELDPNLRGYTDILATAYELSAWDIALAGEILIVKPENRRIIYSCWNQDGHCLNSSGGWHFTNHLGFMDIYGNKNTGFSSYISRFTNPHDLICVSLLTNKGGIDFTNLARKIAATYKASLIYDLGYKNDYVVESTKNHTETIDALLAWFSKDKEHVVETCSKKTKVRIGDLGTIGVENDKFDRTWIVLWDVNKLKKDKMEYLIHGINQIARYF